VERRTTAASKNKTSGGRVGTMTTARSRNGGPRTVGDVDRDFDHFKTEKRVTQWSENYSTPATGRGPIRRFQPDTPRHTKRPANAPTAKKRQNDAAARMYDRNLNPESNNRAAVDREATSDCLANKPMAENVGGAKTFSKLRIFNSCASSITRNRPARELRRPQNIHMAPVLELYRPLIRDPPVGWPC